MRNITSECKIFIVERWPESEAQQLGHSIRQTGVLLSLHLTSFLDSCL